MSRGLLQFTRRDALHALFGRHAPGLRLRLLPLEAEGVILWR